MIYHRFCPVFEGESAPMGPNSKLIYYDDMVYKGWIGSRFILVHKGILLIAQGCIGNNEQGLYIRLND